MEISHCQSIAILIECLHVCVCTCVCVCVDTLFSSSLSSSEVEVCGAVGQRELPSQTELPSSSGAIAEGIASGGSPSDDFRLAGGR